MKYLVTGKEMSLYDRQTSEHFHVPSVVLMEQAAQAFVSRLMRIISESYAPDFNLHVLVVCGTGNNGGDGIAIARLLNQRGIYAEVYAPAEGRRTSELFDLQYQIYLAYGYPVSQGGQFYNVPYDIVIDAIFGTGLSRPVEGMWADIVEAMNSMPGRKIAVDIASGVFADTGEVPGTAFRADDTVTFSYGKLGQYLWPGAAYSGKVAVVPIGINDESFLDTVPRVRVFEDSDLCLMPSRKPNTHKGSYGKLLVIAGSRDMAGAAVFAAKAAYRMGTGLVKVMTPEANRVIIQSQIPEAILSTYDDISCGQLQNELRWADALVIGPGIGTEDSAGEILRIVLDNARIPVVIDADALNIISREGWQDRLSAYEHDIIITPHLGEMSRLTGKPVGSIKENICSEASNFASKYHVICVLKDARTVTAAWDGSIYLNLSGNNGMATAGSGDVLSGILGGLLAQGLCAIKAAPLGVYLHGRAGDAAKDKLGARYMMASDIIEGLSQLPEEPVIKQSGSTH